MVILIFTYISGTDYVQKQKTACILDTTKTRTGLDFVVSISEFTEMIFYRKNTIILKNKFIKF